MSSLRKTFAIGGDLEVNRLGYGAMRLTGKGIWGEPKDPGQAKRVLKRAVELEVNFIDTADSYGQRTSDLARRSRLSRKDLSSRPRQDSPGRGLTDGFSWAGRSTWCSR